MAFGHQHIHAGVLEGAGDIGAGLLVQRLLLFQQQAHGGLQSGKAELTVRSVDQRARQREAAWHPKACELCQMGAAGVGQVEQRSGLVEGFAHRVVQTLAKQAVAAG